MFMIYFNIYLRWRLGGLKIKWTYFNKIIYHSHNSSSKKVIGKIQITI